MLISIILLLSDSLNFRDQMSIVDSEQLLYIDNILIGVIIVLFSYMISLIYLDWNRIKTFFKKQIKGIEKLNKIFG